MAAMTLDSVLNWAVPLAVILIFGGLMYTKMKGPLDIVGGWIKSIFGSMLDGFSSMFSGGSGTTEVIYK